MYQRNFDRCGSGVHPRLGPLLVLAIEMAQESGHRKKPPNTTTLQRKPNI